MYSLGGSLIGELDYHETFELYYFFFEKVFFSKGCSCSLHPAPFYLQKIGEKKNKETEDLLK